MVISLGICLASCSLTEKEKSRSAARAISENAPNIIVVVVDNLAIKAIQAKARMPYVTPNIDRLAQDGFHFTKHFSSTPHSAPARAALLTGKMAHHSNVTRDHGNRFETSNTYLPQILGSYGYQTAMFGTWKLGERPLNFDHHEYVKGEGSFYNPVFITEKDTNTELGYLTNLTMDKALEWMKEASKEEDPFFVWCSLKGLDRFLMPETSYLDHFDAHEFQIPPTFFEKKSAKPSAHSANMSILDDIMITPDLKIFPANDKDQNASWGLHQWNHTFNSTLNEQQRQAYIQAYQDENRLFREAAFPYGKEMAEYYFQRYLRDYFRTLKSVDDQIGNLLDYLEKDHKLDDNTIVVLTSDNGAFLGEHGWFGDRMMYEPAIAVPFYMKYGKKLPGGRKIDRLTQHEDLAPTLLNFAGIPKPKDMHGKSLLPLFEDPDTEEWREAVYFEYFAYPSREMVKKYRGIRTDRFKLIEYYEDGQEELYDLKDDPEESENKLDHKDYEQVKRELRQKLNRLTNQFHSTEEQKSI